MDAAEDVVEQEDFEFSKLQNLPVKEEISKAHFIPEEEVDDIFNKLDEEIKKQVSTLKVSGATAPSAQQKEEVSA